LGEPVGVRPTHPPFRKAARGGGSPSGGGKTGGASEDKGTMNLEGPHRVLAINPGSTSTRAALFEGEAILAETLLPVPGTKSHGIWEEFTPRLEGLRQWMAQEGISASSLDGVVGRGGLLRPVEGGTYLVTEAMLADARGNLQGSHASNLGCALARAVADAGTRERGRGAGTVPGGDGGGEGLRVGREDRAWLLRPEEIPAFVVDPVSTDEFLEPARVSGLREIPRKSLSHALSIHALVREVCRRDGRPLEGSSFVVAHLGGGISVCPVRDGRILDANNANSGGPFSPSRAGGLPTQELLELAYSGRYSLPQLRSLTLKEGGLKSHLGTDDARKVETRVREGDEEARMVFEAMAYQIAKEIGAMATVLEGRVDAVLLTGGLASSEILMGWVRKRVEFLAPVEVLPEVEEMRALARGCLRVLRGEEEAKIY
jgi:butyrate kinase